MSDVAQLIVSPGVAHAGAVAVPGDKSISHRALMLGALADGRTSVTGFLNGEDCLATLAALRQMGVGIELLSATEVRIAGVGLRGLRAPEQPLDLGNSGTGMRLMAGLLVGQAFKAELTGDKSLRSRPMERIAVPLREMGADIASTNGCAPLRIVGGQALRGIDYASPVVSAQVKSAVLLAGLYAEGFTTVREQGVSRDHTERMLRTFGVDVTTRITDAERVATLVPAAALCATDVQVPGDLSSAAFVLGAGCLGTGPIAINDVGINPTRTGVLDILRLMGADIEVSNSAEMGAEPVATLTVRPARLQGVEIPSELVPLAIDELPLIFALAACAEGDTIISGAAELRHKESDRIAIMVAGLQALGVAVEERPDGAVIRGGAIAGGTVDAAGDHRIAMAFAVIAGRAAAPVTILDAANIVTSFPGFVELMSGLGLNLAASDVHG